jgi:tryptophan synthase alpha chain
VTTQGSLTGAAVARGQGSQHRHRSEGLGGPRSDQPLPTSVTTPSRSGLSRIPQTFARLRADGRFALVGWQTIGYPDKTAARRLIPNLIEGGFDMIELGVPFSDPQADGPTIQRASQVALANGTTLTDCHQAVRDLRADGVEAPLIFMTYYNPILAAGVDRFAGQAAAAGLDGVIVPDLPPEESDELLQALEPAGIDLIFLVAPTSTEERLAAVAARARGFVYCVSLTGVTGAREDLLKTLPEYLARVRRHTALPLVVGFGVSRPEHVAALRQHADGAVIASAIVDLMGRTAPTDQPRALRDFAASLREAAGL